ARRGHTSSSGGSPMSSVARRMARLATALGAAVALVSLSPGSAPAAGGLTAPTMYPVPTPFSSPWSIAAGPDGALWFTERLGHRIGRITPSGSISEIELAPTAVPWDIAAGPDGNMWFTDNGASPSVSRINITTHVITPFPLPGGSPEGITAAADGNLWVAEPGIERLA